MERYQKAAILKDLEKKLVFITGPRQVGKTWLAQDIARLFEPHIYLNYDNVIDRKIIRNQEWLSDTHLLVLDEMHKMPQWKTFIKGVYDTKPDNMRIIVIGSARLEAFRQSGDSLAGRFFRHRLLPFAPSELAAIEETTNPERLLERGGFPEPYLASDAVDALRWRNQYIDGLIRTDILDFEKIHDFKAIQLVLDLLKTKVGSPVSYKSIAGDVGISPHTAKKYIQIFESLFIVFRVFPHSKNIARSILKEPKVYFYDTGMVASDEGIRLENLVAVSLLKHVFAISDYCGIPASLCYLRTKDKKEVDFCIVEGIQPKMMIEVKRSENIISKTLFYFNERYHIPGVQIVLNCRYERKEKNIEVRDALSFLKSLR